MFMGVICIPTESTTSPYCEWESMTNARRKNLKLSTSPDSKRTVHTCNNTVLPWRAPLRCVTSSLGAVHRPQFHCSMFSVAALSSLLINLWHSSTSSDIFSFSLSLFCCRRCRDEAPTACRIRMNSFCFCRFALWPSLQVLQSLEGIILVISCREFTGPWAKSASSVQAVVLMIEGQGQGHLLWFSRSYHLYPRHPLFLFLRTT
jgi:hypothetical protein